MLFRSTIGIGYSQSLQATGGTPPFRWSATGLPGGLALDPNTGILSGAPSAASASTISVTVADAVQGSASAQLPLTIRTLAISPVTLPSGFVGVPYPATPGSSTLGVAGVSIVNWAVTSGALPAGLTLGSSTGAVSGIPTVVGSSTFIISATPGAGNATLPPVLQQYTLVVNAAPSVVISGLTSTAVEATQPTVAASLIGGIYPLIVTGTMTLTFVSASGGAQPYDAKFATGTGTTATFTIPAGNSQGLFGAASSVPVMIGTVAGTITITTKLQDSNNNSLPPPAPMVITINPTVPFITRVTLGTVTVTGFSISVTGRSTPRAMTSALFRFTPPTNSQLVSADVTVPLSSAFVAWYGSSASNAFGSTFTMTVPFTFAGPPGITVPYTAVTVTLTNSVGSSGAFGPVSP